MLEYFLNARKCRKAFSNDLEFNKNKTSNVCVVDWVQSALFPQIMNIKVGHICSNVQMEFSKSFLQLLFVVLTTSRILSHKFKRKKYTFHMGSCRKLIL